MQREITHEELKAKVGEVPVDDGAPEAPGDDSSHRPSAANENKRRHE